MLTIEILENKGFARTVYEDQSGKPVFYTRRFDDIEDVKKLHRHLNESIGEFDFDYEGLYCVFEISEDLQMGQYLFSEKNTKYGTFFHDKLTPKEFESLLDVI
jgi:hypothetical protein